MNAPIESWSTEPRTENALVPVGQGLALACAKHPGGWAFAWILDGEPLVWPNPYTAGSAELN